MRPIAPISPIGLIPEYPTPHKKPGRHNATTWKVTPLETLDLPTLDGTGTSSYHFDFHGDLNAWHLNID